MEVLALLFIVHLLTTFLMTGVIWVVQLVHYPAFLFIDRNTFPEFERFHSLQISKIVMPLMLVEFFTGLFLLAYFIEEKTLLVVNLGLLIATWGVTAFFSMRYHKLLLGGFNREYILKLVRTNILRTIFWSMRSVILFYILFGLIGSN